MDRLQFFLGLLCGGIFGILWFFFFENSKKSNAFYDSCWVRKKGEKNSHIKVYLVGLFLLYRGYLHNDIFIAGISGGWLFLHLAQNIAEWYHLKIIKKNKI